MPIVVDFSNYIAERTRRFVGREWVFAEIDRRACILEQGGQYAIR
jgi:hypothetical protein